MSYKIAIATTDGKVVNQHFGRADVFYIVMAQEDGTYEMTEERRVPPVCDGGTHEADAMQKRAELLSDCEYVLVSMIGNTAEQVLDSFGIKAYVIPDLITEAVTKLISYIEINKMIYDLTK